MSVLIYSRYTLDNRRVIFGYVFKAIDELFADTDRLVGNMKEYCNLDGKEVYTITYTTPRKDEYIVEVIVEKIGS